MASPGSLSGDSLGTSPLDRVQTNGLFLPSGQRGDAPEPGKATQIRALSLEQALSRLEVQQRLKAGAENLLQVLDDRANAVVQKDQQDARKVQVLEELNQTNRRILALEAQIDALSAGHPAGPVVRSSHRQRSDDRLDRRYRLKISNRGPSSTSVNDAQRTVALQARTALLAGNFSSAQLINQANELAEALCKSRGLRRDLLTLEFAKSIVRFCTASHISLVTSGLRLVRYFTVDGLTAQLFVDLGVDVCLVDVLARETRSVVAQEQGLRLIRALAEHSTAQAPPQAGGLVRAVTAIAESDSKLNNIALETLAELLLVWPVAVISSGALGVLVSRAMHDVPSLADVLIDCLVHLADDPKARQVASLPRYLDAVFAPFTDAQRELRTSGKSATSAATAVVANLARSWPGLLILSDNQFQGLASIVQSLRVPDRQTRDGVLELVSLILDVPKSLFSANFLAGRRPTVLGKVPMYSDQVPSTTRAEEVTSKHKIQDQEAALRLLLLLELGLLEALVCVVEDDAEPALSRKATFLVSEVLHMTRNLLPLDRCRELQSLAPLFEHAARLGGVDRLQSARAIFQIDSLTRLRNRAGPSSRLILMGAHDAAHDPKRGQRQVEQVKIKMGIQIDDSHFRNLLLDTHVLSTKNYAKWHWDTLTELVQGPLLNHKRLEETIRATKFMKRLLAFFRPFTERFSKIKNTKPNQRYVQFGCLLLETLLASGEGVRYLSESKLLRQLSECLAQLDPMGGLTAATADIFFSRDRLRDTVSHGYFAMLGVLSGHAQGSAMMERWRIYTSLYRLTDLHSRHDLVNILLSRLQYGTAGHARIMLSKALTTGVREVRLFATRHLGSMLSYNEDKERDRGIGQWAMRLLVSQLYDPNEDVCRTAVDVLQEACKARRHLEHAVELRPMLDHLGELGAPLLLRFLATRVGFTYLFDLNYIDRELDNWHHGLDEDYVVKVELHLHSGRAEIDFPSHFYGQLAKTEQGCALLMERAQLLFHVQELRKDWSACLETTAVRRAKAALWALGSIGAEELGLPFLSQTGTVANIVEVASNACHAGLRGTAYLVLGMLARTTAGVRLIEACGWLCVNSPLGRPGGVCVPPSATALLRFARLPEQTSPAVELSAEPASEMVDLISNLSNHILANDAARRLVGIRQRSPEVFASAELYEQTLRLLATCQFRLPVRQFVLQLFPAEQLQRRVDKLALYAHRLSRNTVDDLDSEPARPVTAGPRPRSRTIL